MPFSRVDDYPASGLYTRVCGHAPNGTHLKYKITGDNMSFADISIARQIPVIRGYVQMGSNYPFGALATDNNLEQQKTETPVEDALLTGNYKVNSFGGSGSTKTAGGKYGVQMWLEYETGL